MIILKVIGGLGNQMFEVAFARMLSLELKEDIYLDCSVYRNYKIRSFSISNLNISNNLKYIEDSNLNIVYKLYLSLTQKIYHIYQKIIKVITGSDKIGENSYKILSKYGLYYNFDVYYYKHFKSNRKVKSIYGYFQSEDYFKKYKDIIVPELKVKTLLTEREKDLINEINACNAVGISMRLGDDYINSKILNVCTKEYYYNAMKYISNKEIDPVFFIFSDCIERVKKEFNFKKYNVRYIEGFKDYESLRLLYSCKHFIISNSSFSWWGAYLGEYDKKIIVAPNKWYNNSKKKPAIYLKNMKTIDV